MKTIYITSLLFLLTAHLSASSQHINSVTSLLQFFEKDLDFNGVVLISKGNEVLLQQGYGFLDSKKSVKTNEHTIFNIASITKTFTGIAVMKLVEQGKLKLTDTLSMFFQNVPAEKSGISIHHLLIHQSGIPQAYVSEGEINAHTAAEKILKIKTDTPPGEKFIYSNDNYTLLAIIIEKVSGKKWNDFVKETILTPLNMTNTFFWGEENTTSLPMVIQQGKSKQEEKDYGFKGGTGMFSNGYDLLKFIRGIKSDVVLNDSSRALLFGNYIKLKSAMPNSTDFYGYGIFHTKGETESIWTRGYENGWGTSMAYFVPGKDIVLIILSGTTELKNGEKSHIYVSAQILKHLF